MMEEKVSVVGGLVSFLVSTWSLMISSLLAFPVVEIYFAFQLLFAIIAIRVLECNLFKTLLTRQSIKSLLS